MDSLCLKISFRGELSEPIRLAIPLLNLQWTQEFYIELVMLLCGSTFTVGLADKEPCKL